MCCSGDLIEQKREKNYYRDVSLSRTPCVMLFAWRVNRCLQSVTVANACFSSNLINFVTPIRAVRPISSSVVKLHAKNENSGGRGRGRNKIAKDADKVPQGAFARTDDEVRIPHPDENQIPRSAPGVGRSGPHPKRTLASFSLNGRVAVITGGAQGLGLVMAQALIVSGADVAIVDLNSKQD